MKRAVQLRSYEESFRALLIVDGIRPAPVADLVMPGWHCLVKAVGAAVTIGTLPLPVRREGRIVAQIVEVELRGDDWYGRVEVVEEPAAGAPAAATRGDLAANSYTIAPTSMAAPTVKPNRAARRTEDAKKRRVR